MARQTYVRWDHDGRIIPPQTTRGQYALAYQLVRIYMKQGMFQELQYDLEWFQRWPVSCAWRSWGYSMVADPLGAGYWRVLHGVDDLPF